MIKPPVRLALQTVLTAIITIAMLMGCGDSVTEAVDEVVRCRSLPGDRTAKNVDAWKYDAIHDSMQLIDPGVDGLTIAQLTKRLAQTPKANLKAEIMDFEQVAEYVLLEMEVRGELVRMTNSTDESETVRFTNAPVPELAEGE